MILVLNEWLFHDLLLENDDEHFRETALFVFALTKSADVLVIPVEERWSDKAYRLMTMSDVRQRQVSIRLQSLMWDADRTIRIQPKHVPEIPQEFLDRLPCEDVYLVEAYGAASADLLITTDGCLCRAIHEDDGVNCQMRAEFLSSYSAASGEAQSGPFS